MTGEKLMAAVTARITAAYPTLRYVHIPGMAFAKMPGFPDLFIVGPQGMIFRECKGPAEDLNSQQVHWKWALKAAGADWDIWRPIHWETGQVSMELENLR